MASVRKLGYAVVNDLLLSAITAVLVMFAAPFLHQVLGTPRVHPGFLPCWLVLFALPFIVRTAVNQPDKS